MNDLSDSFFVRTKLNRKKCEARNVSYKEVPFIRARTLLWLLGTPRTFAFKRFWVWAFFTDLLLKNQLLTARLIIRSYLGFVYIAFYYCTEKTRVKQNLSVRFVLSCFYSAWRKWKEIFSFNSQFARFRWFRGSFGRNGYVFLYGIVYDGLWISNVQKEDSRVEIK